jgi:hypothetical protein
VQPGLFGDRDRVVRLIPLLTKLRGRIHRLPREQRILLAKLSAICLDVAIPHPPASPRRQLRLRAADKRRAARLH